MAVIALLHILNEESVMVDLEQMPDPNAQAIVCTNPRKRDGKEIHYVDRDAVLFFFPWHKVGFVEILGAEEEAEEVITFVRE